MSVHIAQQLTQNGKHVIDHHLNLFGSILLDYIRHFYP